MRSARSFAPAHCSSEHVSSVRVTLLARSFRFFCNMRWVHTSLSWLVVHTSLSWLVVAAEFRPAGPARSPQLFRPAGTKRAGPEPAWIRPGFGR